MTFKTGDDLITPIYRVSINSSGDEVGPKGARKSARIFDNEVLPILRLVCASRTN